jgi:AcrR family transcriptional regulator
VSELNDRRARKKAKTRAEVHGAAQRLFAERGFDAVTIADIAAAADVAVQTVFNHFATKEELFFDGRTPWVAGAAAAVRDREPTVAPLTALRTYLVTIVGELEADSTDDRRRFRATIDASPALRSRELELVNQAEQRLAEALTEAWTPDAGIPAGEADPATAAALVAATWLAVVRVFLTTQRPLVDESTDTARPVADIAALAERLMCRLEKDLGAELTGTGTPCATSVRRAG